MMADGKTPKVRFFSALTKTIYIARRLRPAIGEQPDGRIATAALRRRSAHQLCAHAAGPRPRQPQLHRVERSHRLLREAVRRRSRHHFKGLRRALPQARDSRAHPLPRRCVAVPARRRKTSRATARLAPCRRRFCAKPSAPLPGKRSVDDLATVIFSSGSTGDPKGVMLTHYNIASNIQQVSQVFMLDGRRQDPRHPALLPLLRLHGRALDARRATASASSIIPIRSTPR